MSRVDDLRAQLELAEVEDELIQAKAERESPAVVKAREKLRHARADLQKLLSEGPDLTDIKQRVRAARETARASRSSEPTPVEETP